MLVAVFFVFAQVGAFRVNSGNDQAPNCECALSTVVRGVDTGHAGCDQHFGQRFGYVCYVEGGSACPASRESHSHRGAYWRSCATEHYTEEAKEYLEDAMEGIDEEEIQRTIAVAEERGVDQETLDAAAQRIEVIHQMTAAEEDLLAAIDSLDYDRLQAALRRVEELELDEFLEEETLQRAVEHFSFLGHRRNAHHNLHRATEAFDLDDLLAALEEAREHRVDSEVVQRGENRAAELQRMRIEAASELATSVLTRDVQRVSEAILQVERLNAVDSSVLGEAHDRLHQLVLMDEARVQLLQSMLGHNLHELDRRIEHAIALDVDPEVLSQGRQRAVQLVAMSDSVTVLEAAMAGRDVHLLREALAEAVRLEATTGSLDRRASFRLSQLEAMDEATNELRALFSSDDSSAVRHALRHARELHCDQDVINEGERTRHRISRMKSDLRSDLLEATENGTDPDELQRLIDECTRLRAASHRRVVAAERRLATLR